VLAVPALAHGTEQPAQQSFNGMPRWDTWGRTSSTPETQNSGGICNDRI
jgi:hypothetical protein